MKRLKPVGLMASGRMVDSPLVRIPALARDLGPVAAPSLRLASRFANTLRAGHAAPVDQLGHCDLVLIQAPGAGLPALLHTLLASKVSWRGRAVALIGGHLDSSALDPLRAHRAHACAVGFSTLLGRPLAVAEGDPASLQFVRAWMTGCHVRLVELRPGARPLFAAGLSVVSAVIPCVVDVAVRSLHSAGLSPSQARQIVSQIVENSIVSYMAHGRKSWLNPAAPGRRSNLEAQLAALAASNPALARFHRRALAAALEFFWRPCHWLETVDSPNSGATRALPAASIPVVLKAPSID